MLAPVLSAALAAVDAFPVRVEVNATRGLPAFTVVGLPDGAVREGKERVLTALSNAGYALPPRRITVNLAPADVRKDGSSLDLPVAVGLLVAVGQLDPGLSSGRGFVGELGLDGALRPVRGVLAMAAALVDAGVSELWVPPANRREAALVPGLTARSAETLPDLLEALRHPGRGRSPDPPGAPPGDPPPMAAPSVLGQLRGRSWAMRGLEIAAAGGHNLMLEGPPGSGKTWMARGLAELLPPADTAEALEITRVHSAAGLLPAGAGLQTRRPFRAPHHTASHVGMIGGGPNLRPGEVSLAHRGVLFLDEAPEWPRRVLETLRQPLETGEVTLVRARGVVVLPARFTLVSAMNPCPCGWYGEEDGPQRCTCSEPVRRRYQGRLSGPFRDRIDLWLKLRPVPPSTLLAEAEAVPEMDRIRGRIATARSRQAHRSGGHPFPNRDLDPAGIRRWAPLRRSERSLLERAATGLGLSARGCHRVLRVARTLADLSDRSRVEEEDLLEALQFRSAT
jgi:magnesium chelatase family protein